MVAGMEGEDTVADMEEADTVAVEGLEEVEAEEVMMEDAEVAASKENSPGVV